MEEEDDDAPLPGGEPRMSAEMAPRATAMLAYVPRIVIFESARTMRVRDEFSMMKRILPSWPARRPIARERWSPWSILTSLTSKDSCER